MKVQKYFELIKWMYCFLGLSEIFKSLKRIKGKLIIFINSLSCCWINWKWLIYQSSGQLGIRRHNVVHETSELPDTLAIATHHLELGAKVSWFSSIL
jgi:hypothetical protein